jgi:hypothetical protein
MYNTPSPAFEVEKRQMPDRATPLDLKELAVNHPVGSGTFERRIFERPVERWNVGLDEVLK